MGWKDGRNSKDDNTFIRDYTDPNYQTQLSREIARVTSHDPCIIKGCIYEYGHVGKHEYPSDNG